MNEIGKKGGRKKMLNVRVLEERVRKTVSASGRYINHQQSVKVFVGESD